MWFADKFRYLHYNYRHISYSCILHKPFTTFRIFSFMERQFDNLDLKILGLLATNARESFQEIARVCDLSGAAINQRIKRLVANGVIRRWDCVVNPEALGYKLSAFVGIHLMEPSKIREAIEILRAIPEVVSCNVTSGRYDLLIRIMARDNEHLYQLLQSNVHAQFASQTETLICFDEAFTRQVGFEKSAR